MPKKLLFAGLLIVCLAIRPLLAVVPYSGDFPSTPGGDGGSATVGGYYDYYNGVGTDTTMFVTVTTTRPKSNPSAAFDAWESALTASTTQALVNSGYVGQTTGFMPYGGSYDPNIYEAPVPGLMQARSRLTAKLIDAPIIWGTSASIEVIYRYDQSSRQILTIDQPTLSLGPVTGAQLGWRQWYTTGPATITNRGTSAIIMISGTLVSGGWGFGDPPVATPMRVEVTVSTVGGLNATVQVFR
jgi:hypothetical protein